MARDQEFPIDIDENWNVSEGRKWEGRLTICEINRRLEPEYEAEISKDEAPVDKLEDTARHIAAREGSLKLRGRNGLTPLHSVVSDLGVDALLRLLQNDGDTGLADRMCVALIEPLARNIKSETLLDIAAQLDARGLLQMTPRSRFLNVLFHEVLEILRPKKQHEVGAKVFLHNQILSAWSRFLKKLFHKVLEEMQDLSTNPKLDDLKKQKVELLYYLVHSEDATFRKFDLDEWRKDDFWKYDSLLWLVRRSDFDKNGLYGSRVQQTALHVAVLAGYADVVKLILEGKKQDPVDALEDIEQDPVDANKEDSKGITPLHYAWENGLQEIQSLLTCRREVKDVVERLYRDRQVYVDAANAILVGAALIASVTFAGWLLQPPSGFSSTSSFWVLNGLSFFFAIATVVAGAGAVVPVPDVYIGKAVDTLRKALSLAAALLVFSVVFVLGAFASAGFAVLPPPYRRRTSLIVTVVVGGTANLFFTGWFLKKLYPLRGVTTRRETSGKIHQQYHLHKKLKLEHMKFEKGHKKEC